MAERLIPAGEYAKVRDLYVQVSSALKESGYGLDIRGDAWMRDGGISAKEYVETPEGQDLKRFHMVRMTRAGQVVTMDLDVDAAVFKLKSPDGSEEVRPHAGRVLLAEMREILDAFVNKRLGRAMLGL